MHQMKILFLIPALILSTVSFTTESQREFITRQFERMSGEWEGFMEYTDERDDKTRYSMPALCTTNFTGKRWEYYVRYEEGPGEYAGGKGDCSVNDDGSKINYNGIVWDVVETSESGDTARIVMETKGKDNRQKAQLRQTIQVTATTFMIMEEVKYLEEGNGNFFLRNKHIFRRKKS